MPVERPAQLITVALPVLYLDKRVRLKARIHGRPRSNRKRSFLLSAVAPSTSTRHPRKARPINWAQRGGLASGRRNVSLRPRPHFTAHHARLVTRWFVFRTALLFVRSAVRLVYAELPDLGHCPRRGGGTDRGWLSGVRDQPDRDRNVSAQLTGRVHVFLTCAIPGIE
jgi:hypothetical protein